MTALDSIDLFLPEGLRLSRLEQLVTAHDPARRPVGDCYRTSIACLIGAASPDDVPHFVDQAEDLDGANRDYLGWEAHRLARTWLRSELELDLFPFNLTVAAETGRPYLADVRSRRGPWSHVIVAQGAEVIHDPTARLIAEAGLDPYTWADVVAKGGSGDLIVLPYDPDPDEQLAIWKGCT